MSGRHSILIIGRRLDNLRESFHPILLRIGENFFDDPIATIGIYVGDSITQRVQGQVLVGIVQMSFVTKKRSPRP
jgi:hypothetical protein